MSCTEVPIRTSAEVTAVCVGAAELAGVLGGGALVDVRAAAGLLVVEARGAEAAEAPQGVVARRPPADLAVHALVLVWLTETWQEVNKQKGIPVKGHKQYLYTDGIVVN